MSSTKKKTIKVRLFTMIFMIRELGCDVADARNALFGPKVYATSVSYTHLTLPTIYSV